MMGAMAHTRPGAASRHRAWAVAGLLVLVSGCTPSAPPVPQPAPTGEQVALEVSTAPGGARGLEPGERTALEGEVGELLSAYLADGFLGDYPRERFVGAFDDFTAGAAALAAEDIRVLTASGVSEASAVDPRSLEAVVSFLVEDGEVVGATAHLDVALEATMDDGSTQRVTREGRLMLLHQRDRWAVFGFDLAGDDGTPLEEDAP